MNKGPPAGAFGLLEELHVGLVREAVALAGVAGDAGADHVLPRGLAAPLAGQNVIEIEFLTVEPAGAILAGVVVALVNVLAREFHFFAGQAVEVEEHDHSGDADVEAHGVDHIRARLGL